MFRISAAVVRSRRGSVALRGSGYVECTRLWNSAWHDDSRRTGDVVVWCLDPSRVDVGRKTGVGNVHAGVSKGEVDDAVRDPHAGEGVSVGGQKVLGATKGKGPKQKERGSDPGPGPMKRVVEKTFWKVREVEDEP